MSNDITQSVPDTLKQTRDQIKRTNEIKPYEPMDLHDIQLNAAISIGIHDYIDALLMVAVHGNEMIASLPLSSPRGFAELSTQFSEKVSQMKMAKE